LHGCYAGIELLRFLGESPFTDATSGSHNVLD